jgi:hypothetical protein
VAEYPHGVPGVVREPLLSGWVVCDPLEAGARVRAHPAWVEDRPPLTVEDPMQDGEP